MYQAPSTKHQTALLNTSFQAGCHCMDVTSSRLPERIVVVVVPSEDTSRKFSTRDLQFGGNSRFIQLGTSFAVVFASLYCSAGNLKSLNTGTLLCNSSSTYPLISACCRETLHGRPRYVFTYGRVQWLAAYSQLTFSSYQSLLRTAQAPLRSAQVCYLTSSSWSCLHSIIQSPVAVADLPCLDSL